MAKKPRIKVPKTAKSGETILIKTLMSHKMETGVRKNKKTGKLIPRKIINKFVCKFNGMFNEAIQDNAIIFSELE